MKRGLGYRSDQYGALEVFQDLRIDSRPICPVCTETMATGYDVPVAILDYSPHASFRRGDLTLRVSCHARPLPRKRRDFRIMVLPKAALLKLRTTIHQRGGELWDHLPRPFTPDDQVVPISGNTDTYPTARWVAPVYSELAYWLAQGCGAQGWVLVPLEEEAAA